MACESPLLETRTVDGIIQVYNMPSSRVAWTCEGRKIWQIYQKSKDHCQNQAGPGVREVKGQNTPMIQHQDSHVDHGLTEAQLRYLLDRFADREAFFLETIELPADLGTVPCSLYGPTMGDPPVSDAEVTRAPRGVRTWSSRLVERAARPTRLCTVIAGPHEETCSFCRGSGRVPDSGRFALPCFKGCEGGKIRHACVLYTAFGGPASPQEPGDPDCKDPAASAAFWREHALAK